MLHYLCDYNGFFCKIKSTLIDYFVNEKTAARAFFQKIILELISVTTRKDPMPTKNHHLLFGAHLSIAGGFDQAIERGESINCTAIQIFTKSNRMWQAKPIAQEDALAFKNAAKNSSILSIIVHASYLINIASCDKSLHHKSVQALKNELLRCQELGITHLVLHPGAAGSATSMQGIELVAQGLDEALDETPGDTIVLIENMAGQGTSVGSTFEQLAAIHKKVRHKKELALHSTRATLLPLAMILPLPHPMKRCGMILTKLLA